MKTLPTFFLLATLAIGAGHAQESPITGPPPCRFLFLVESSKGMARISSGTAATVAGLVASGVSGLMRPGDSFAVWHFNEEPFQFDFPNQVWHPDKAPALAAAARAYLQKLRCDQPVRADLALREMFIAMRATDPLTVVLISNGESPMVGTPFDVEINKVYLRREEELRKARLPFVTTLRCVNRQIEHAAVTAGREEIVLPEAAPKTASAAAAANPSAASPTKAPSPGGAAPPSAPAVRPARSSGKTPPRPELDTTPLSAPPTSAVGAPTTVVALAPRADDAASAAKIGAPSTNGTLVIAPPPLPPLPGLPGLPVVPARAEGPVTLVKIVPAPTNGEGATLLPPQLSRLIPPATATTAATGATATTGATGATAMATSIFPRRSAPSFALETAGGRSAPGAPAAGNPPLGKGDAAASPTSSSSTLPAPVPARLPAAAPVVANPAPTLSPRNPGKPLVPERIPEPPKRNAAVTNAGGKTLATVPPLIRPETTTRPIHFLFAGLVLLAVAGWFIVLIFRGSRRQSRSSISRAMDE